MGLDINGTKFLLYAQRHGVSFAKTAMIGRQELLLSPDELKSNFRKFGIDLDREKAEKLILDSNGYAEGFFGQLGADKIVSFDASPYENASFVHDFNDPIPDKYKIRFTAVLDGGTLEHIFNFPAAIKNCMEMVAEGGHFLSITPTNNQLGHGFYQFSPELFFRIFSPANGFEIQTVMIFEETPGAPWYEVTDPDTLGERVTLVNGVQSMLLVVAKKIETVEIFRKTPQQSDYVSAWSGNARAKVAEPRFANLPLRNIFRLPIVGARKAKIGIGRAFGMLGKKPAHFKRVDIP